MTGESHHGACAPTFCLSQEHLLAKLLLELSLEVVWSTSLLGSSSRAPAALEERIALKQMVHRSNPPRPQLIINGA